MEFDELSEVCFILDGLWNGGLDHLTLAALVSGAGVSVDGNTHTNVARNDGSKGSNQEGDGGVWEVGLGSLSAHLGHVNGEADDESKGEAEESKVEVLSP